MSKNKKAHYTAFSKLKNPVFLIIFIFLAIYTISVLFPLLWGFMTSFKEIGDFEENLFGLPNFSAWDKYKGNPKFEGKDHPLSNYTQMFINFSVKPTKASWVKGFVNQETVFIPQIPQYIGDFVINSILYTVGTSFLKTLAPMIVGYLCARYRNKFSAFMHTFVVFVMVTPIVGGTAPMLALIRGLGIYDSWFDIYLRSFGNFANMFFLVFFAFFESASNSYAEAAEIDGASQFRVMVTIYFPLAMTMFGTVFLMNFVEAWNDYNTPLMYLPSKITLAYAVYYITDASNFKDVNAPRIIATTMILAIPTLVLFVAFKNKLMGNLSLGGVKE